MKPLDGPVTLRCDIFCNVIDNYGDIGVCWRLARQLANEYGLAVRLWVDDLGSFAKLCPEADATLDRQHRRGVEVRHWTADAFSSFSTTLSRPVGPPLPLAGEGLGERVADLVIEAFACKLPQSYIEAMAALEQKPLWINLEYLSAEDWVHGCHGLPSPHPVLPLVKYFFFPGFTKQTGGLLLERDLLARRDAFQNDTALQQAFWQSFGIAMPDAETLKISLFAYENAALYGLFDVWANGDQPVLCLVPEGRILPQVRQYFGNMDSPRPVPAGGIPTASGSKAARSGETGEGLGEITNDLADVSWQPSRMASCPIRVAYSRGNLQVHVLPFVEQERYDELLWACDVNFVRGEDSCVRAQWAARPFIWQIYPQHDAVHWEKLQAFLHLYNAPLSTAAGRAMQDLWQAWNGEEGAGFAWPAFDSAREELGLYACRWARELAANNLALNLLDFCQKIGRMRAFKIDRQ
ncbi:MAG: elongation factor P maturation arginine rhamnosyltransferase EarP [Gallionella sp.]|nr:elongation factor P maturation arginine rhamnosyltransferase EarP [Gallionella sp.]